MFFKELMEWIQKMFVRREYKDRLFKRCFQDKRDLLELYNALNGSHYTDPSALEITTLEDGIYMSMKNDMSFIIFWDMCLYEHQSTYNPNIPLRGMFYFARLYSAYVELNGLDIYGRKRLELPSPHFVVFYNGEEEMPDVSLLKLSELYKTAGEGTEKPKSLLFQDETPALECVATMLNINYGHNEDLMKSCKRLHDYAYFVEMIREGRKQGLDKKTAIYAAMDFCIEKGVLKDMLLKHRAESYIKVLSEFDEKAYKKRLFREGREEGREEGIKLGIEMERANIFKVQQENDRLRKLLAEHNIEA